MDHIIREVIEVELYPSNMNREDGFSYHLLPERS
jgi:hypothetical protein